jgi:hypothetical protein
MKRTLSAAAQAITPPIIWNAYLRARGLVQARPWRTFGNMQTCIDARQLTEGRFAELHDRYRSLDPFSGEAYRYRHYNVCCLANLCRHIPGDFVCAGVSFGMTAKVVYEFVNFPALGKTFHLIDPLEGVVDQSGRIAPNYNRDPDYVLRQYPPGAPVVLHRARAPLRLPGPLAFVFTDTGNAIAGAESLPVFYESLSPGGMIVAFEYGQNAERFAPIVERLGITPFWLPSGQGVIVKQ